MPSTRFVKSIAANLAYWHGRIDESGDPALRELIAENQNLYRAVEFGLALPETWRRAAELIYRLDAYIEHSGIWRPWQALIEKSLARCAADDDALKLNLLDQTGQYYRRERAWDACLAAHQQAERLATKLADRQGLARTQRSLGLLYWRRRSYAEAMAYSRKALDSFLEIGASPRDLGGILTCIGLIEYGRGSFDEAVAAHLQAVDHFRDSGFTVLLARSLVNLALAQEAAGDPEAAMTTYIEAQSILEETEYEMDKARLGLSFGSLLYNLKRFDEAEEVYLHAYSPYLKRSGLTYYLGLATNNLGSVYLEQGKFAKAAAIFRESLAYWQRAGADLQAANTRGNLARALAAQGRYSEAKNYCEKALSAAAAFADDAYARVIVKEVEETLAGLPAELRREGPGV